MVYIQRPTPPRTPPEPVQLLLTFAAIMDAALKTPDDGVCVSDLEELSLQVRTFLYIKGFYDPDDQMTVQKAMEAQNLFYDKAMRYEKALLEIRAKCPADGPDCAWAIATDALCPKETK